MRSVCFSAVAASMISITAPSAFADQKLGEVIGTIARTVLEQQQAQHESALWQGVVENGSAAAYRQYLDAYPQGPNARNAREQLAKVEAASAATNRAAQSEAALALTQTDRLAIQRRLAALGLYKSDIDGVFGAGTRRAVAAWQEARKLPATGYLNSEQHRLLLGRAEVAPTPATPLTANPVTTAAQAELNLGLTRSQRVQTQRDLIALGYDPNGVDGLFGAGTREAIRAWQRNTGQRATGYVTAAQVNALRSDAEARGSEAAGGQAAAIDEDLLGLTRNERAEIQQRLVDLGYFTGRPDGVFGASTRTAITRWQGDNGLDENGYLTAEQVRTLQAQVRR